MAKVIIPENLKGKELTEFLLENKEELISQKKSLPVKHSDVISLSPEYFVQKDGETIKAAMLDGDTPDNGSCRVKVVMNAANWCDSHMDVLIDDCWKKTIKERKGLIPHLHDHEYEIDAELGDVKDIYSTNISLRELGLNADGKTQVLIFETEILESYNEKAYKKYRDGKIKQHSIGLQYVKIDLAINDDSSVKEKEFWDKHIGNVINRKYVEDRGFFWVVSEIKLLEGSAVLFGSNVLTPTLEVKTQDTLEQRS